MYDVEFLPEAAEDLAQFRPARADSLWPTATAAGKQHWLKLKPASAGDRYWAFGVNSFCRPWRSVREN